MSLLEISHLHKSYGSGARLRSVFEDLSLTFTARTFTTILGRSGVGKTSFLRILSGLDQEYSGEVKLEGKPLTDTGENIGLVFQDNRLLPWKKVRENVSFSLLRHLDARRRADAVRDALNFVGMSGTEMLWPRELSGGMAKRAAVARALAPEPTILLLDEPFAGLDPRARRDLSAHLLRLNADKGLSAVFVTHDVDDAIQISNRIIVFRGVPAKIVCDLAVPSSDKSYSSESYVRLRQEIINQLTL